MTYAGAGVDIKAKDEAAKAMAKAFAFRRTGLGAPLGGVGHFAGMVEFGEYALVLATDGVGTKLEIATAMRKWDTVGIDCVAMNVNDAICVGAEPIAFVDYLAVDKADPHLSAELAKGLDEGCRQSNMTLIGGETAILPSIVKGYDLAGTVLAYVRKDRILTGQKIAPGDVLIGLPASGIHSNGYTLARRIFEEAGMGYDQVVYGNERLGDVLLTPTTIYVRAILDLVNSGLEVHGVSNITGSGLLNIPRLNKNVRYVLDNPLEPNRIFQVMQELGRVTHQEMYKTFNMGMGLCVIVPESAAEAAVKLLAKHHPGTRVVGRVHEGHGTEVPRLGVRFEGAKANF